MKKTHLGALLAVLLLVLPGCSVTVGGGGRDWDHMPSRDAVVMAEIDAAANLMLESNREKTLKNIAIRPQLAPQAQVYLVQVALEELMLESSRKSVILALINNPSFVAEAKMEILENLDELMLESSRQEVMDRLNRRGHVPSASEMEAIASPKSTDEDKMKVETTIEVNYSTGL